jgi:hypothetical protein
LIQPEAVLPLAFDRVPLDQFKSDQQGLRSFMYLPISLGGIVLIVVVLWLLGVV